MKLPRSLLRPIEHPLWPATRGARVALLIGGSAAYGTGHFVGVVAAVLFWWLHRLIRSTGRSGWVTDAEAASAAEYLTARGWVHSHTRHRGWLFPVHYVRVGVDEWPSGTEHGVALVPAWGYVAQAMDVALLILPPGMALRHTWPRLVLWCYLRRARVPALFRIGGIDAVLHAYGVDNRLPDGWDGGKALRERNRSGQP